MALIPAPDMKNTIIEELEEHRNLFESIETLVPLLESAAAMIVESIGNGGRLVVFGNGGSAADAQHIVAELVGRFEQDRRAIPAQALTVNTSILTSVANDYDFAQIFARQVEAAVKTGDVAIAISTSGTSPNVLEGARQARAQGARVIALTGENPGPLADRADLCLAVPSRHTARIQEGHIFIGHVLCKLIEAAWPGRVGNPA